MRALVGLGNPGPEYEMSRHNVGFLALDEAAHSLGLSAPKRQLKGLLYEGRLSGERVALFKPLTYMNLSGEALAALLNWFKLAPGDVMVFSDDADLLPGAMRIRARGGAGTHNGWRNIIQMAASQAFPRARIGVGAPPPGWELRDWVLSRWDKDENAAGVKEAILLAAQAGKSFLEDGMGITMNRYNLKSRPAKKEKPVDTQPDGEQHAQPDL